MNVNELFDSAFCVHLTLTLTHFLWQGLAIVALAASASWCLRSASAQRRYWVHLVALLLMVACLPVTFVIVRNTVTVPGPISLASEPASVPVMEPSVEGQAVEGQAGEAVVPTHGEFPTTVSSELPAVSFDPPESAAGAEADISNETREPVVMEREEEGEEPAVASASDSPWKAAAPYATGIYLVGLVVMLIRLWLALHGGYRLRRCSRPIDDPGLLAVVREQAQRLGLRLAPAVAYCERVAVPVVVGVLRPMILLPVSLSSGLTADQLQAILTHELVHLRRYDHLVLIAQRMVEAVLFFHPAVWYVSWRIGIEREHCCDDAVVASGHQRGAYAESLVRVAELSLQARTSARSLGCATLGAADGKRSRLRNRILRLIDGRTHERIRLTRTWPAALLLFAALAVMLGLTAGRAEPGNKQPPADKVADFVKALGDEDPVVRARAADGLGRIQPPAAKAVSPLIKALTDEDRRVRESAAASLGRMGDTAEKAVPTLAQMFENGKKRDRFSAALALSELGSVAKSAAPLLADALSDDDEDIRMWVAEALAKIAPSDKKVISALIDALGDKTIDVRYQAAYALGRIGRDAKEAIPSLSKLLDDEEEAVRTAAGAAMRTIRAVAFVDRLTADLKLTPKQEAKVRAWFASRQDWAVLEPAALERFLRKILDAKQRAVLDRRFKSADFPNGEEERGKADPHAQPPAASLLLSEVKPRLESAAKALELEKQGKYRAALDLLQKLRDGDFFIPAGTEITGETEDGRFMGEWVDAQPIGNRRLAMMRCNLQLGNPREAVDLAWQTMEAETADNSAFACIAQHSDLQGGFDQVESRLRDILKKNPKHHGGRCLDHLRVERDLADRNYPALIDHIRSEAWIPSSESGGSGVELQEYVAVALARRSKETLPDLIKALNPNEQPTWIVYCLIRSGDERAIEPLFDYLLSAENTWPAMTSLALSRLDDKAVSYAITKLDSKIPLVRERVARVLSECSGDALQKGDPGLKHILQALRDPRNHGKDGWVNIPLFLLRAVAATRNHDYLDEVRRIKNEAGSFGAFADDAQYGYTRAFLGDTSVVPDLIDGLAGKYDHFARPALEAVTGKSFRTQEEWQAWWKTYKSQDESDEGGRPGPKGKVKDLADVALARIKAQLAALLPDAMTVTHAEIAEHPPGAGLLFAASAKDTSKAHPSFSLFFWPKSNEKDCPYESTAGTHTFRRIGASKEFDVYYSNPDGVLLKEVIRTFCTQSTTDGVPHGPAWGKEADGLRMFADLWPGDPSRLRCVIRNHGDRPVRYCDYLLGYFKSVSLKARPVGSTEWIEIPRVKRSRDVWSAGPSAGNFHDLGVGDNMPSRHKMAPRGKPCSFSVELDDFSWPETWQGDLEVVVSQQLLDWGEKTWKGTLSSSPVMVSTEAIQASPSHAAVYPGEWVVSNGLQSRIVFERTSFKQGEPIEPKVFVRNVSDEPIPYNLKAAANDFFSGCSRFEVIGPDGSAVADIAATSQTLMDLDDDPLPKLKPGQTIAVFSIRLDTHHYMRAPGRYRIRWKGMSPWPSKAEMDKFTAALSRGDAEESTQRRIPSLPPSATVEIEVAPAPGDGPDGDLVGRLLKILPPGWKIEGAELLGEEVQPQGRMTGSGSSIGLLHRPKPNDSSSDVRMQVYVMKTPSAGNPQAASSPIEYLGKGKLGYVYLMPPTLPHGPGLHRHSLARWSHAAYDIATALDVTDPVLKKPTAPDWGRMTCRILSECLRESKKTESLQRVLARLPRTPHQQPHTLLDHEFNLVPPTKIAGPGRKDPALPYYRVGLSVRPAGEIGQLDLTMADKSIKWDGEVAVRGYRVKRLGVEIIITVMTDDVDFRKTFNAILDREISRVLAESADNEGSTIKQPPADELAVLPDFLGKLDLTPQQEAKVRAWFAARENREILSPAKLAKFLRTILDDKQQAIFNQMVESPTIGDAPNGTTESDKVTAEVASWLREFQSDDSDTRLKAIRKAGNWVVNGTHACEAFSHEDPAACRRAAAVLDAGGRQEIIGALLDRLEKNIENRTGYQDGIDVITRGEVTARVRVESENEALANALRRMGETRAVGLLKRAHAFLRQQSAEEREGSGSHFHTFAHAIYMLSMERVDVWVWEAGTMKPFEPGPILEEEARRLLRPDLKATRGLTASLRVSSASKYPTFFVGETPLVAVLTVTNHSDRPISIDLCPETITLSCVDSNGQRINIPTTEMIQPVVDPVPQTLAPKGATSCTWHIKRLKDSPLGRLMKSESSYTSLKAVYTPRDETVRKQWGGDTLVTNTVHRPYFDNTRPDGPWHQLYKSNLVAVDVERTLYEKPGQPHFFIRVQLTNLADRPVGVDLRDEAEVVYPNQWGPSNVDHRQRIDERRRQHEPLDDAARAKLPAEFRDGKLTMIPAGKTVDYYREFNASGRADVEAQLTKYKYLIISLDGVLRVTDGKRLEEISCSWDRADNSNTDMVIATPVPWKRVVQRRAQTADRLIRDLNLAPQQDSGWSKPLNGLRARLVCDKKTFVLGRPMEVTLELECFGEKDYDFPEKPLRRCQLFPHIDVHAKHVDGEKAAPRTPLNIPNRLVIVKGRPFRRSLDLAKLLKIDQPGKYVISAGHSNGVVTDIGDWTGKVLSPPLVLTIVAADAGIDDRGDADARPAIVGPTRGIQVRLRAKQVTWPAGRTPALSVDIRNGSKDEMSARAWRRAWDYVLCDVELDGAWREGGLGIGALPQLRGIAPGKEIRDIRLLLGPPGFRDLQLAPGKHTIRARFHLWPTADPNDQPPFKVVSNPVQIEIVSTPKQPTEKRGVISGAGPIHEKMDEPPAPTKAQPDDPKRDKARTGLPPAEALRDMGELVAALKPRVAKGWELSEVKYGPTFQGEWPVGWGFHVMIHDNEAPVAAGRRAPWTDVHIWVLDRSDDTKGPFSLHERPIEEIAPCRGRRVFVYGGKERWPTRIADVRAAIKAVTDGVKPANDDATALRQRFFAFARFAAVLPPKVPADWHCTEFRYGRDQISNPGVPQGWGCHVSLRRRWENDKPPGADEPYGEAQLWLMDPSYDGRLPEKTDKNFVPDELARWHGGRTFLWGFARGDGNWHAWKRDLRAALDQVKKPGKADGGETGEKTAESALRVTQPATRAPENGWSLQSGGLSGRFVVAKSRITTAEHFDLSLELRNVNPGGGPWLAVQEGNPFWFEISLTDASGKEVRPTLSRVDILLPAPLPWRVIRPFPDERLTIPASLRGMNRDKDSHLDTTMQIWRLPPGKYKIGGTFLSPKIHDRPFKGEGTPWTAKMELPPIEVEIIPVDATKPAPTVEADDLPTRAKPTAAAMLKAPSPLPRSTVSLNTALGGEEFAFVGRCEALEETTAEAGPSGIHNTKQKFKLLEVLAGDGPTGQTFELAYSILVIARPPESVIPKGERVLWVVWKSGDALVGIKALADTREKRQAVAASVEVRTLLAKIKEIESQCIPAKGDSRAEVEQRFGKGKPIENTKIFKPATADSRAWVYEFCENGTLLVRYDNQTNSKVLWAHYLDPYSVKGRLLNGQEQLLNGQEQLRELRPRLKQMEAILAEFQRRFTEVEAAPGNKDADLIFHAADTPIAWSKPVHGLQYRLYVAPHDPAKTKPVDALTIEVRNVTDKPIEIDSINGQTPCLSIRVADYRELRTPVFSGAHREPFVLQPGKTWSCKVSDAYIIAYGRYGGGDGGSGWLKFNPAGKTYELSVNMPGEPLTVKLVLPERPEPAVYWPPTGKPAPLATAWSQPTEEGLQARIAGHAKLFALGDPIPMRVELRHKDMKNWGIATIAHGYQGTITVSDSTGKQVGRRLAVLDFNTVLFGKEFDVVALFDSSHAEYGIDKPGKYSVRFDGVPKRPYLVALPASEAFEFEVRGTSQEPATEKDASDDAVSADGKADHPKPAWVEFTSSSPPLDEPDAELYQLIEQLQGDDWEKRSAAAWAIGEMGPKAAEVVPALMQVLGRIKPGVDGNMKNDEGVGNIRWALGQIGKPAVPQLLQAVEKGQSPLRDRAVAILGGMGPQAKDAAPALAAILRSDEEPYSLRSAATFALGAIRSADPEVVAALVAALNSKEGQLGNHAAKAIGEIDPPAEQCIPALVKVLMQQGVHKTAAADALGKMAAKSDKALTPLLEVIRDTDGEEQTRRRAVRALVQMGSAAEKVLPDLIAALSDKNFHVRANAAEVLANLGPRAKDAVPVLTSRLTDEHGGVRYKAAQALGAIGPAAKPAEKALRGLSNDEIEMVRDAAAKALNRIAPPLTCQVTVNKTKEQVGGFVTATVQLKNISAKPVRVLSLEPVMERQDAGFFVSAKAEGYSSKFPEPHPSGVKPYEYRKEDVVELAPGKTIERRIQVGWSYMVAAGISAKPGKYNLVGRYVMPDVAEDVWHGEVISAPVVVRIMEHKADGTTPLTNNGLPNAWSKPDGGLSGRLVVAKSRITTAEHFDLSLELRNVNPGGGPWLAVQEGNPFWFEISLTDASGKEVRPTLSRVDILLPAPLPWRVIRPFPDERLTIPASLRGMNRDKDSHLDTTMQIWRLPPGKYKIGGTFLSPKIHHLSLQR